MKRNLAPVPKKSAVPSPPPSRTRATRPRKGTKRLDESTYFQLALDWEWLGRDEKVHTWRRLLSADAIDWARRHSVEADTLGACRESLELAREVAFRAHCYEGTHPRDCWAMAEAAVLGHPR